MRSERKRRGRKINILRKNIESTIQRQIHSVVDLASFLRPQNQRLRGAASTWRCDILFGRAKTSDVSGVSVIILQNLSLSLGDRLYDYEPPLHG